MSDSKTLLYHGSNVPIERPQVSLNTGFADLGRGFYLTDFISMEEFVQTVNPAELVVQYCFADQDVLDAGLVFVGAEPVSQS